MDITPSSQKKRLGHLMTKKEIHKGKERRWEEKVINGKVGGGNQREVILNLHSNLCT